MTDDFAKFYEKIRKKHTLPPLEKLDEAFEISIIEEEKFFLRECARKICDLIDTYIKMLEEVLQPEPNIGQMREANAFTELEKKKVYTLYKQLRYYLRLGHESVIDGGDKACVHFIKSFFEQYPAIRKDMGARVRQMKDVWERELVVKSDLAYLG